MNRQRLIWIFVALGIGLITLQLLSLSPRAVETPEQHAARLLTERADKDTWLRTGDDSPLPPTQRAAFAGLPYFAPNPSLRVAATLNPSTNTTRGWLNYTQGKRERLDYAGELSFVIEGKSYALQAYWEDSEHERLFVPFTDATSGATSGATTYGGGRYLRLEAPASGNTWDLDFNSAYHPYCVYDSSYVCPIPPAANRLPLAIAAGERLPEGGLH